MEIYRHRDQKDPLVVVLDFSGIESLTSSYTKSSILWLLRCGEKSVGASVYDDPGDGSLPVALPIYLILAHLSDEVREEIEVVLRAEQLCCLVAVETKGESVLTVSILGSLDRTLRTTLRRVEVETETTAAALHAKHDDDINVTGWNNRLSDLHRLRLLHRRKEGRQWIYAILAPLKENNNG
ncbi:hypothetical protein [Armatimonas sp.]|uniref:hypothetical protein n=1 Tax=Armatimonas sp. TaxID=1872638 RepID=UPI00286C49C2|nr:hypothetical protein [Armatimonas sp.]